MRYIKKGDTYYTGRYVNATVNDEISQAFWVYAFASSIYFWNWGLEYLLPQVQVDGRRWSWKELKEKEQEVYRVIRDKFEESGDVKVNLENTIFTTSHIIFEKFKRALGMDSAIRVVDAVNRYKSGDNEIPKFRDPADRTTYRNFSFGVDKYTAQDTHIFEVFGVTPTRNMYKTRISGVNRGVWRLSWSECYNTQPSGDGVLGIDFGTGDDLMIIYDGNNTYRVPNPYKDPRIIKNEKKIAKMRRALNEEEDEAKWWRIKMGIKRRKDKTFNIAKDLVDQALAPILKGHRIGTIYVEDLDPRAMMEASKGTWTEHYLIKSSWGRWQQHLENKARHFNIELIPIRQTAKSGSTQHCHCCGGRFKPIGERVEIEERTVICKNSNCEMFNIKQDRDENSAKYLYYSKKHGNSPW